MATIDQLHSILTTRFQGASKNVQATDFSGNTATLFTTICGGNTLTFSSDSTVSDLMGTQFKVVGKIDVWRLALLECTLLIEEVQGNLTFTLAPTQAITNWHFAQSFPVLQSAYLDYLEIPTAWLIGTSYDHDNTSPAISLKTGLNFYGNTQVTEAISSLKALYPSLTTITLKGTIASDINRIVVQLSADLPDMDNNTTDDVLHLNYDSTKTAEENNVGEITGVIHRGSFTFNQEINIPLEDSPLTKVFTMLQSKLQQDGTLSFQNTDFGGTLGAKLSTVLNVTTLSFTNATLTKDATTIGVKGKMALLGLSNKTVFNLQIVKNVNSLELIVFPDTIPTDWLFSNSFPQAKDTFFDELTLANVHLIASSYAYTDNNLSINIKQGLNLSFQTTNTRALFRLQEFDAVYNNIALQGSAIKNGEHYDITLTTAIGADMTLQLLGFQVLTFKSPILNIQSKTVESVLLNTAYISGICETTNLSFGAKIIVPIDYDPDFHLIPNDTTLGLANIVGVLSLSSAMSVTSYFPTNFTALTNISVQGPNIDFIIKGTKKSLTYSTMTLVEDNGTPKLWELLSSPHISVGNLRVGILYGYFGLDNTNRDFIFRGSIGGTIVIGSTTAVDIDLSVPISGDWTLSVVGTTVPSFSDIAAFISKPQTSLTAPLPNGVFDSTRPSVVSGIEIGFNPFNKTFSYISYFLNQTGSWDIVTNLSLENWKIFLNVDATQNYAITGNLHGYLKIGTVANIEANIPIPAGNEGWTFQLAEGTIVSFPSLGEILTLAGGNASNLPSSFTSFLAFDIVFLGINVNPSPATVNWFRFALQGRQDWILIDNKLAIGNINAYLSITKKDGGGYDAIGGIGGIIKIKKIEVAIVVEKKAINTAWKLRLATNDPIHIPGLSDLASWMMPTDMGKYIPSTFMPFGAGFDITNLNIDFDVSNNNLKTADFSIVNSAKWDAIPHYLSFDNVLVKATINNFNQPNQALSIHIECVLAVGSANILFTADRQSAPTVDKPWEFSLALQSSVSFQDLIQESKLSTDLVVPSETWIPDILLTTLTGKMIPANGIYQANATTAIAWQIPFINVPLPLTGLGAGIDIRQKQDDTPNNYKKGYISGTLSIGSLEAVLALQLGTAGVPLIFTATLTNTQARAINLTQLSNSLIASSADTTTVKLNQTINWTALTPTDTDNSKIKFDSAFVLFNKTDNKLFIYGSVTNFGSAVLLAQQANQPAQGAAVEQGYLFAVALAPNFKFSNLFSSLSIIDNVLTIRKASLVVNSYSKTKAKDIQTEIDSITSNPFAPATITSPFQITSFPSDQVDKGLHIFAALDLTSPLFSKITGWRKTTDTADVTLYGFFPQGNKDSTSAVFSAEFANFELFNTITFKGASQAVNGIMPHAGPYLQYVAKADGKDTSGQFTLIGQLGVTAFSKTLSFDAAMVVNNTYAQLTLLPPLSNGQSVVPFPDVLTEILTIKNLGVNFKYTFAQTGPPAVDKFIELDLYGSVSILETIDFTGHLHLLTKKEATSSSLAPVLVSVTLTSELSISKVFNKLVSKTGSTVTWPDTFFDIAFLPEYKDPVTNVVRKSELYYYKKDNDSTTKFTGYTDGYNLESTIALTFINNTINFNLKVNIQPGVGIKANLGVTSPINLYILELAGTTQNTVGDKLYLGGPELVLDTTKQSPEFGFATGFNFLKKPFGTATILFGKDSKKDLKVSGTLTTAFDFSPFNLKDKRLSFSYSKNDGFRVDDWPNFIAVFQDIMNILDSIKQITDAAGSGGPCAAIADFVTDVAIKTKFGLTSPKFETQNNKLYFILNGTYTVLLLSEVEVCTVTLPSAIKVPIPNDLSLDNLLEKIAATIGASALNFVKALMDNPDALAKFIGIVAAKNAAKIGAQMLCRGLIDAAEKAAIEAAAGAVSAAAAEAGTTIAAALGGGALAVGAIVSGAAGAISHSFSTNGNGSSSSTSQSNGQQENNPTPPRLKELTYSNGQITAKWSDVMYAVSYEYQLTNSANNNVFSGDVGDATSKIVALSDNAVGDYTARVRSVRGSFKSDWSNTLTLTKLAAPTNPKIEFNAALNKLSVTWAQVAGTNNFVVQMYKDNTPYQQEQTVSGLIYNLDIDTLPAGSYKAAIYANGDRSSIPSESVTTTSVIKTATPANIIVALNKTQGKINISWATVPNNIGFKVRLLNNAGQEIPITIPVLPKDTLNISLNISDLPTPVPTPIKIQVQSLSPDRLGSGFGDGAPLIDSIAAPTNVIVALDKTTNKINISWATVLGNEGYNIWLMDKNGQAVAGITTSAAKDATAATIDVTNIPLTALAPFKVQIQTKSNNSLDSNYTEGVTPINRIAIPTGVTVVLDKTAYKINISWTTVIGNEGYDIRLMDKNGQAVAGVTALVVKDATATSIDVNAIPLTALGPFKVQIQTKSANSLDSDYTEGVTTINRVAAPTGITVVLNKELNKINIDWATVVDNDGYNIHLMDKNGQSVAGITATAVKNANSATIDMTNIPLSAPAPLKVQIQTKSNESLDSDYTEGVTTINRIAAPTNVTVTLDRMAGTINVGWAAVANNEGYNILLLDANGQALPVAMRNIAKNATSATIDVTSIPLSAPAPLKVQIQTKSNNSLDSNYTEGVTPVNRIAVPTGVTVALDKTTYKINISWTTVIGNEGYDIRLVDKNGQVIAGVNAIAAKDATAAFLDVNAIPLMALAPFKVQIQTKSANSLDSDYTDGATPVNRIDAPTGVTVGVDKTAGKINIGWQNVTGNNGYKIQYTMTSERGANGMDKLIDKDVNSFAFDFTEVDGPSFISINIQTLSTTMLDSHYVEKSPEMVAAPTNVIVALDKTVGKINVSWTNAADNEGYNIRLVDFFGFTVAGISATATRNVTTATIDVNTIPSISNAPFKVQVQTKSAIKLNSVFADGATLVNRIEVPTGVTVTLDKTQGRLNVTWVNVANNNGYKVQVLDKAGQIIPISIPLLAKDVVTTFINFGNIPLSDAAPLKVQVQTLSAVLLDSRFAFGTPLINPIAAPTTVTVTLNKTTGKIEASWADVAGNNDYSVNLISANGQKIPITEMFVTGNTVNASLNISDISNTATAPFKVLVQTLATDKLDSTITEGVPTIDKIATPTGITVALNKAQGKINLTWVNVANNNGYKVQVLNNIGAILALPIPKVAKDVVTTDLNLTDIPPISATPLNLQVQALSADKLDSNFGDGAPIIDRVGAPASVAVQVDKAAGKIKASWTTITGNNGHKIWMVSANGQTIPFSGATAVDNFFTYSLNISDIPNTATPPFKVQVQTVANDSNTMDSVITEGIPTINRIDAPTGLAVVVDKRTNKVNVNWAAVPLNNGYTLLVKYSMPDTGGSPPPPQVIGVPVTKDVTTALLEAGVGSKQFTIQIQTLSVDQLDSPFSPEVTSTVQIAEPSNVTVALDKAASKIKINWVGVPLNNGYNLHFVDDNGNVFSPISIPKDATNTAIDISVIPVNVFMPIKVRIQTLSVDKLDSRFAFGMSAIARVAAPSGINVVVNDSTGVITANWVAVQGNNGYNVRLLDANKQIIATKAVPMITTNPSVSIIIGDLEAMAILPFTIQIQTLSADKLDSAFVEGTPQITKIPSIVNITNTNYWLPELRYLPYEISFDFICRSVNDELIACYSKTKAPWAQPNVDALTWYMSPHRDDFTFRTQMFATFPNVVRHMAGIKAEVGKSYKMRCVVEALTATYYINDQKYATATYPAGTIPTEGYFGFIAYAQDHITIQNMVVTKVPITVVATVQANQKWQNTGAILDPNRPTTITYQSGRWIASPFAGTVDANGRAMLIAKDGYTLPGAPEGALIGRVNNNGVFSAPFLVGNSFNVPTNLVGIIELCINDDLNNRYGIGFGDNSGAIQVLISR
jgi:hypothetical protein